MIKLGSGFHCLCFSWMKPVADLWCGDHYLDRPISIWGSNDVTFGQLKSGKCSCCEILDRIWSLCEIIYGWICESMKYRRSVVLIYYEESVSWILIASEECLSSTPGRVVSGHQSFEIWLHNWMNWKLIAYWCLQRLYFWSSKNINNICWRNGIYVLVDFGGLLCDVISPQ